MARRREIILRTQRRLQGAFFFNVALVGLTACNIHSISSNTTTGSGGSGGATASSSSGDGGAGTTAGAGGASTVSASASASTGSGSATATSGAGGGVACAPAAAHIFVITTDKKLYQFDHVDGVNPPWTIALVGALACPTAADPYSIAVDRSGLAWVVYTDGNLFKVDTATAACTATTFVPGQHGFTTFSVAFAADVPGGSAETLYASGSGASGSATGLGTIDPSTLVLTSVGNYSAPTMGPALAFPIGLAGGGDAKLSGGMFVAGSYNYALFDGTNAHTIESTDGPSVLLHNMPADTRFGIIPWGYRWFQIFTSAPGGTRVYLYDHDGLAVSGPADPGGTLPYAFLAVGASTCETFGNAP